MAWRDRSPNGLRLLMSHRVWQQIALESAHTPLSIHGQAHLYQQLGG
ncbi:hypothetical protein COO91_01498 [Nostoc flagelliforme CCNUN1]|uniref:Uncharacterized protein n=1 Tax=Nostoc flagelliforme CCNUN1 TaxID=2038116 RepID=A0A2K8SJL8_9NOSO|nr:hypothetical protein COO91_01498 [Nostoc flagelliforme CCNUN1]